MSEEIQGPSNGGVLPAATERDDWAFFVTDRYQMYQAWWRKKILENFARDWLHRQAEQYLQQHGIDYEDLYEPARDQVAGAVQDNLPD